MLKPLDTGILCICADFEMAWSGRIVPDDRSRDRRYEGTDHTIKSILSITDKYGIPMTWATVGALMLTRPYDFSRFDKFNNDDSFFCGNWYDVPKFKSDRAKYFYAPQLVERIIKSTAAHEIGCHTFTHIYCGSESMKSERFQMELESCREVAKEWGINLQSFVYPSQYNAYLDILEDEQFKIFRYDSLEWFRFGKPYIPSFDVNFKNRLRKYIGAFGKYIDERMCITPKTYQIERYGNMTKFINSSFLPGYYGVSKYVSVHNRIRRMCKGIDSAIKKKKMFSFFFHPWNFNKRRDDCLLALETICRYAAEKREKGLLKIVTMDTLKTFIQ